jgi:hypothetical protein
MKSRSEKIMVGKKRRKKKKKRLERLPDLSCQYNYFSKNIVVLALGLKPMTPARL